MAETHVDKARPDQSAAEATRGGPYFTPRVDIYETNAELTLYADVPGVRADDVDLRYERGELLVHARVRPAAHPGHVVVEEYEEGDYYRTFQIHESIDSTRMSAECKGGVLIVHLPKAASAQPRKVAVKGD